MAEVSAASTGVSALAIQQSVNAKQGNTVAGEGGTEESKVSQSPTAIAKASSEQATQSAAQDTGVGTNINVSA